MIPERFIHRGRIVEIHLEACKAAEPACLALRSRWHSGAPVCGFEHYIEDLKDIEAASRSEKVRSLAAITRKNLVSGYWEKLEEYLGC